MRLLLATLAVVALGSILAACGSSSHGTASQHATNAVATGDTAVTIKGDVPAHGNDRDNDGDNNDDDEKVLYYGHTANAADRRISIGLIKRYFAAAVAEDGAKGCSMLVPSIAESVAENSGHSPALRGKTCATVLSKIFKLEHRLLLQKNAMLRIIDVRVEGTRALAVIAFPRIPEVRQITERRVGHTWRLVDLTDGILE